MTRSKDTRLLRYILALLATVIMLGSFALTPHAIPSGFKMSDTYRGSKYGQNASALLLDGDARTRVLSAALSQIGYHEGNSLSEITGKNKSGSGNFTEYNYYYGSLQGYGYGYPWCAAFVSWCMRVAEIPTSTVKSHTSCTLWVSWFQENSQYKKRGSYTPKAGDVIFFKSSGVSRTSDHVGLVLYTKSGTVYTVEGNSSDGVNTRSYSLNDTYIVGYGIPDYAKGGSETDFSVRSQGVYIVNTSSLNVRNAPSTSSGSIMGSLTTGDMVKVTDFSGGSWGKINYNGKEGWISLNYTQLVEERPDQSLSLDLLGGDGVATDHKTMKGEMLTLPNQIPSLTGHIFKGWATEEGGKPVYAPGESIKITANTKLYAVWEKEVYTVSFYGHDGSLIGEVKVAYGDRITPPRVIPEKESTDELSFRFVGWDGELTEATEDTSFNAVFEEVPLSSADKEEGKQDENNEQVLPDLPELDEKEIIIVEIVSGAVFLLAVAGIGTMMILKKRKERK